MKHYLLYFLLLLSFSSFAQSNSFNVRVHDKTHLKTKGEYSKKVLFPVKDKNISDVSLFLTLNCPDGGCSDWDYSISVLPSFSLKVFYHKTPLDQPQMFPYCR